MTDHTALKPEAAPQAHRPRKHWLAWLLVALVCGALCLPLLYRSKSTPSMGGPGGSPGASITAEKVQAGSMDIYLDALGTVTPLQTVNVYSQVSGRGALGQLS